MAVLGLHHITSIAADPQRNVDFYAGFLGLRLVKRTVNFDDPASYHLYYGDATGRPGTIMTFFAWPSAPKGRAGVGQAIVACLEIPRGSLGWWIAYLLSRGVRYTGPFQRFEESFILLNDPDGMTVELVTVDAKPTATPWDGGPVPAEHAILGLHSVTLLEEATADTERLLTEVLGYKKTGEQEGVMRFAIPGADRGAIIDLKCAPDSWRGQIAAGTIHHVALRAADDEDHFRWRTALTFFGSNVSPIMDRSYFRSIYFREPGGVLLEIATDPPGFTADEPAESLGSGIQLPPWLEAQRSEIEAALPPLHLHIPPSAHPPHP